MAGGGFLASRGMAAQPAGEESCRTPLRQVDRGAAVLRPDQATRGRVGRAPGQLRETQWRHAPPTHEGHPGSANSIPPTQPSAGRYRSDLAPFLASSDPPLSGRSRRETPRWCCTTLGEPDPLLTDPTLATLVEGAGQRHDHTRVGSGDEAVHPHPAPPGAGRCAPSCVRDRDRQGRNGTAGSSEADEPGPKGDAKPFPFRLGSATRKRLASASSAAPRRRSAHSRLLSAGDPAKLDQECFAGV